MGRHRRHVDADHGSARKAHLGAEAGVQRRRSLGEPLEHGGPSLGRAVVLHDELDTAGIGRMERDLDARRVSRASPPARSLRGGSGRARPRRSPRARRRPSCRRRSRRGGGTRSDERAPLQPRRSRAGRARGARGRRTADGDRERPRAQARDRVRRPRLARSVSPPSRSARPASIICEIAASCWTGPSWMSSATRRRSSCSESMRSARSARSASFGAQSIIASRSAIATACVRVSASSFARMCRTWLFTVSWLMKSFAATSAFDIPSARS